MKVKYEYSHLGGKQILLVDYPKIYQEIHEIIKSISDIKKTKISKEKTKYDKLLYSPKDLNLCFKDAKIKKTFSCCTSIYNSSRFGLSYS